MNKQQEKELTNIFYDIARDLKEFYLSPKADVAANTDFQRIKDKWLPFLSLIPKPKVKLRIFNWTEQGRSITELLRIYPQGKGPSREEVASWVCQAQLSQIKKDLEAQGAEIE